jgi:uncharacterized membrane protein SpoIIM required for sporulation
VDATRARRLVRLLAGDLPQDVRACGCEVGIALGVLVVSAATTALAGLRDPVVLRALLPQTLRDVGGQAFDLGPTAPAALAIGFYVRHNVQVALLAFLLGLPFGVGTLVVLVQNGMVAGATWALAARAGAEWAFLGFIAPHAPWELAGLALAAGAGLHAGFALAFPGTLHRAAALRLAAPAALHLLCACALLLAVAAVLEGTVAPSHLPARLRLAIGAAGLVMVTAWFLYGGRRRRGP